MILSTGMYSHLTTEDDSRTLDMTSDLWAKGQCAIPVVEQNEAENELKREIART